MGQLNFHILGDLFTTLSFNTCTDCKKSITYMLSTVAFDMLIPKLS